MPNIISRRISAYAERFGVLALVAIGWLTPGGAQAGGSCPAVFERGVLHLDFQPAFLKVDAYDDGDGLTISSFFNTFVVPGGDPPIGFFERDLVARIPRLDAVSLVAFDPAADVEVLTDLGAGPPVTVWPNGVARVPDGVLPFEAVVMPQGFISTPIPGRLSIVDVSDPGRREYLVDQSTQGTAGFTFPLDPNNSPRAYHRALFIDMDGDGRRDIVTVRSGFRVVPSFYPPFSELVWFRNPGSNLAPDTEWDETVLYGGPATAFLGPDIHLAAHDFEGDGVPEIVATHFFSAPAPIGPTNGKITIYGAPVGGTWADVDALRFALPRVNDASTDQGLPFDVEVVDLNLDGRADILASNHQPDNCTPGTSSAVAGRVYALEQPEGGPFDGPWTLRVLLDGIRPQPSLPPVQPPGRLAPGTAKAFVPVRLMEGRIKPWVLVAGDEAGKVWVLRPRRPFRANNWDYRASVIFDINDVYGAGTTQTPLDDPFGVTISTIGEPAIRYDRKGPFGHAELYIPVFEARDIHVLSLRPRRGHRRVRCVADETLSCPAP